MPFGRGNKGSEAIILSVRTESERQELKYVLEVLDDSPVLSQEGLRLAFWLRERYFCTIYDGVKTILPAGLWYRVREVYHVVGDLTQSRYGSGVRVMRLGDTDRVTVVARTDHDDEAETAKPEADTADGEPTAEEVAALEAAEAAEAAAETPATDTDTEE